MSSLKNWMQHLDSLRNEIKEKIIKYQNLTGSKVTELRLDRTSEEYLSQFNLTIDCEMPKEKKE